MAVLDLPYPSKIARDSSHELNFNTITAKFGDTFEEIAPIGLNYNFKTFQITWLNLARSDKAIIKTALTSGGSWQIFSYTPCNETNTYNVRVEKDSIAITPIGNDLFEISAKLKQIFNGV